MKWERRAKVVVVFVMFKMVVVELEIEHQDLSPAKGRARLRVGLLLKTSIESSGA